MKKILIVLIFLLPALCFSQTTYVLGITSSLPKTGQTSSYTTNDDGTYKSGSQVAPRFVDNGDGTISDRVTGLMWIKDSTGAGCNNGSSATFANAITFAEGLTFAGYTDWRMPNIVELMSLIDWSKSAAPYINTTYFTNVGTGWYYWSSTTNLSSTTQGRYVMIDLAASGSDLKTDIYRIRPVRGGR